MPAAAEPVCITEGGREGTSPSPPSLLKQNLSLNGGVEGLGERSEVRGRPHSQKVVLNVAVEGAAQPRGVVLPRRVGLQVDAELGPAVLQTQAEGRPHLQEHGRQLLDVEEVCRGNSVRHNKTVMERCNDRATTGRGGHTVRVRQGDPVLSGQEDLAQVTQRNLRSRILVNDQVDRLDAGTVQVLQMRGDGSMEGGGQEDSQ